MTRRTIAIIGGGPAGLMAAEILSAAGHAVTLYEAMPTVGRKFLLAGKTGLNLTHAEPFARFRTRFGAANDRLDASMTAFPPEAIRQWAHGLGSETFVGSSGRVFPLAMKASPLLRAWKARLEAQGVVIRVRHRFVGFEGNTLVLHAPEGILRVTPAATLLALGGASWPKLGSDAGWVPALAALGITLAPFRPANCGFDVDWSPLFAERFHGEPVKSVTATSNHGTSQGEFVITRGGIEGSLVYQHASALRDALEAGPVSLRLDLVPGRSLADLAAALARQDRKASLSTRLKKAAGLAGVKAALVRETAQAETLADPAGLAAWLKTLPIPLLRPRPIAEAISSAGGIALSEVDASFMLHRRPGLFVAGEMLDWEAPTGGYLLSACLATGRQAALGLDAWLRQR